MSGVGGADGPELSIVIPAFNEAATVGGVIAGHHATASELAETFEIVVCDDGSTDGTSAVLSSAASSMPELHVITHSANQGIPSTLRQLYGAARGRWVYFTAADGQIPAAALPILWRARTGADVIVGRRNPRRDPGSRLLMAQLYSALIRSLFRLPIKDIDSVKLFRGAALRRTRPRSSTNFLDAEMLIELHREGAALREIEVPHRPRISGRAKGVTPIGAMLALLDVALFRLRR